MTSSSDKRPAFTVAALYKFTPFADIAALRPPLLKVCLDNQVTGTLLLAAEGINGTIAGRNRAIDAVLAHIRTLPGCSDLEHKVSWAGKDPFIRMKVRLKKEIVTLGVPGLDPARDKGTYVDAADWNRLISDPDVVVIDTRNDYEVSIGTFANAINPGTTSFREFPAWLAAQKRLHNKPKVAMFCTGGIRCEKSTAYLKSQGFDEVYHLKGGILKYLETVAPQDSLWQGQCFVFDHRVSVGHGLEPGGYDMCHACRQPVSAADKASDTYQPGVSCPRCHGRHTPAQLNRFTERQNQMARAKARGEHHLGPRANPDRS